MKTFINELLKYIIAICVVLIFTALHFVAYNEMWDLSSFFVGVLSLGVNILAIRLLNSKN